MIQSAKSVARQPRRHNPGAALLGHVISGIPSMVDGFVGPVTVDGIETILVRKPADAGMGMNLKGPKDGAPRTGVFVSGVKGGGVADVAGFREGHRLLELNGQEVALSLRSEAGSLLKGLKPGDELVARARFDPVGYALHDGGKLRDAIAE